MDHDYEHQLVTLGASKTLAPEQWMQFGPRFFMAGLAVMLAGVDGYDRRGLLALAEQLHHGSTEPAVFTQWLDGSPLRPSRFLPLLDAESKR